MPISSPNQPLLVSQKLALNKEFQQTHKPLSVASDSNKKSQAITLEVELLKHGDKKAEIQADELFAQANSYAQVSPRIKQSLQAYESLEMSNKREAISSLMGIDLYA